MCTIVCCAVVNNRNNSAARRLVDSYASAVTSQLASSPQVTYHDSESMMAYLADVGERQLEEYHNSYVIAATFALPGDAQEWWVDETSVTAYFNNEAIHSPAVAVNVISNTLLR